MSRIGLNLALVFAAISLPHARAEDTLAKVAEAGKITVAYRESSIPFSYILGPGKPVGFSMDLTNAIVDEVRKQTNKPVLEVGYIAVTASNRIPLLTNGTIDLECGSTTNNSTRGKDVAFAINHFYTGTRLLVKKTSNIKNYADLAGKSVATTTGTTNLQVLRKYNQDKQLDMQFAYGRDHAESFLLVQTDRALAFGMDDILLYGLKASAAKPDDYEIVGDSLQVEPYACMLRKDDPKFKKLVDGVIAQLMKSGKFDAMYKKWFLSPIPPKNVVLNVPMSAELRANMAEQSDKPAM